MGSRLPARYAWPMIAVLFLAAGAVGVSNYYGRRPWLARPHPRSPRPPMVAVSFPPVPAADRLDPDPAPVESAAVDRLVGQLSAAGQDERDRAALQVESLPYVDLPLIESAAARPDLPPAAADTLAKLMPRIRARDKAARRRAHVNDAIADFYEREALAEYDRGGHTDPKWDAAAQTFLHLANARYAIHRPAAMAADVAEAKRQLKVAEDAGCEDPTVDACAGLLMADRPDDPETPGPTTAPTPYNWFKRADKLSGAGPLFRLITDGRMLRPAAKWSDVERRQTWSALMNRLTDMSEQFKSLLSIPGVPPAVVVGSAKNVFDRTEEVRAHLKPYFECVGIPLEQALPHDPEALTLKGRAYIKWAWEARGGGWADSVTPQGWTDFNARLAIANASLTEAWSLDPDDAEAANRMITVVMGRSGGRNEMQTWYRRAMDADPDDIDAAYSKLMFLEPKWGGDPDSMIRFGRQLVAEGNWRTDLPFVLTEAHLRLSGSMGSPTYYWLRPGVWDDVRSVYSGYIERDVNATFNRNQLARYAVQCHQWKAADEQFKALGDQADPQWFGSGSPAGLEEARRTAARLADVPDAQGR